MFELVIFTVVVGALALFAESKKGGSSANYIEVKIDENEPVPNNVITDNKILSSGNLPRGIRNNNAGNIEIGASPWRGKVPKSENTDGRFEQFVTAEYGLRALMKLLMTYQSQGFNSISAIVAKYAPSHENNTSAYANFVAGKIGVGTNETINVKMYLVELSKAIVTYENGLAYENYYSNSQYEEARSMI